MKNHGNKYYVSNDFSDGKACLTTKLKLDVDETGLEELD